MARKKKTTIRSEEIELHGHRVSYRIAGEGPTILLIHGIAGRSEQWAESMALLAEDYTVIAPDLLGHGASAKPRGDYSLGAYASGVRDLAAALGHDRATVVGHSLGGWLRATGGAVAATLGRLGLRAGEDLAGVAAGIASLGDAAARGAFVHTARAAIDAGGQRVSATDRLYLAAHLPTLIVWGERDPIIPVAHGRAAQAAIPGSRLEVFEGAGHFPHREHPVRFLSVLEAFLRETEP